MSTSKCLRNEYVHPHASYVSGQRGTAYGVTFGHSGNEEDSPHVVVQAHRGPRVLHLGDGNKRAVGVSIGLEEPAEVVVPFAGATQEGSMVGFS